MDKVLQPGARIDRYGSDYGSFTSPEGTPYEMRAVAPGTDQRPYSVFEVVEPINVKSGSIASDKERARQICNSRYAGL